jgi:osmoprotectant transport system ATP-binding protein
LANTIVEFRSVSKRYGSGRTALADLSLTVGEGEAVVFVGTSGAGKTTVLKLINRLIEPDEGVVLVAGRDVRDADPVALRRGIGYVIQDAGLFPHMNVIENVETVPRLLGCPPSRCRTRAEALLDLVGLPAEQFGHQHPGELSGGQRQRVGVARALAADPPILLMDEPFGALDAITRRSLREEFCTLRRRMNKTVLFVTHDAIEAFRIGDRIAVLDAGRLRQVGTREEILRTPADEFVREIMTIEIPAGCGQTRVGP